MSSYIDGANSNREIKLGFYHDNPDWDNSFFFLIIKTTNILSN